MKFRYRYVNFGTNFQSAAGDRTESNAAPERLYENEMALDVGGGPWDSDGKARGIVDNHFYPNPYPSAAAGVLHLAEKIRRRFVDRSKDGDVIWLVSHRQPDFDAFSAMYLARSVIQGDIESTGWAEHGIGDTWRKGRDEIDWFRPSVGHLPTARRWPVLLAAYASCVDNCRPIDCPRHRGLHSVLYAALLRGRPYTQEESGALQFFEEVRRALSDPDRDLNPLYDSVLESSDTFAPELALLDRQQEAYERDLQRARKTIVFLQQAEVPFGQWYAKAASTPLAMPGKDGPEIQPSQLSPTGQHRRQVDGLYLRDPQCLLFKDWVRNDLEHSSMREGFTFTAIAYSHERPHSTTNTASYFFSLDPERADRCHLYDVWARLQTEELRALAQVPAGQFGTAPRTCRPGYEARAGKAYAEQFDDPWFDGSSYEGTIVATPGRGTAISAPGATASDLSDDPVAWIVQEELELAFFQGELQVWNFSSTGNASAAGGLAKRLPIGDILRGQLPRGPEGSWRFAKVEVSDEVDLLAGTVAEQIGRLLWRVLDPDSRGSVPTDFVERHLIRTANWVGVWSRQGIVIATKPGAGHQAQQIQELCQELSAVATAIEDLSHRHSDADEVLVEGDELVRRVVRMKHQLTLPENNLVRRFFEAIRLDELLHSLRDINASAAQRAQAASNRAHLEHQRDIGAKMEKNLERITAIQRIVHAVEYLVVTYYGVMLWEHLAKGYDEGWILIVPVALSIGFVVLINHSIEQHWVEWAFLRRSIGSTLRRIFSRREGE